MGWWALTVAVLRIYTAIHLEGRSPGLYKVTVFSFIFFDLFFATEVYLYQTAELNTVAFGLCAGIISLIWMLAEWSEHVPKKVTYSSNANKEPIVPISLQSIKAVPKKAEYVRPPSDLPPGSPRRRKDGATPVILTPLGGGDKLWGDVDTPENSTRSSTRSQTKAQTATSRSDRTFLGTKKKTIV